MLESGFWGGLLGGAVGGAVVTAGVNLAISRTGIKNSDLAARLDDLCADLDLVARLAVAYWLVDDRPVHEEIALRAEILGLQRRIELWIEMLDRESWLFRFEAEAELFDFFEAISGGAFGAPDRTAEIRRAEAIRLRAASLVVGLRMSRRSMLKAWL